MVLQPERELLGAPLLGLGQPRLDGPQPPDLLLQQRQLRLLRSKVKLKVQGGLVRGDLKKGTVLVILFGKSVVMDD